MSSEAAMPNGPAAASNSAVLRVEGLTKRYRHVTALAGVDLTLHSGEVVAVCGDNGAGKSTFVSILSGVTEPDRGLIHIAGKPTRISSPLKAQQHGIATVFQDLALVEQRDVAANMFLGREPVKFGLVVDRQRMINESSAVLRRLRVGLPSVRTLVQDLSGGQRQAVAVARAVLRGSRVLLMDEPTAALGVREAHRVIELIAELRAEGQAVVVISHNVEHVYEVADRIVVFRLGAKVADECASSLSREDLVGLLVHGGRAGWE